MSKTAVDRRFLSVPQAARELDVDVVKVHAWMVNNRFLTRHVILGRPAVEREDLERFKVEHPELLGAKAQAQVAA